jgi:hypothetical protein
MEYKSKRWNVYSLSDLLELKKKNYLFFQVFYFAVCAKKERIGNNFENLVPGKRR